MTRSSEQILTEWLVLQVQGGSRQARETLVRQWYPLLLRYAQALLRNHEDARDAVQETFMTMERRILSLNDPAAYPKWAYRILHRRCMDQFRKQPGPGRLESLPEDEVGEREAGLFQEKDGSLDYDMHRALQKLKPESYLVLHLYYLHDLDLAEIAEVTGTPVGTVKSRLFTARNSLKQHLGGYDEQD